MRIYLYSLYEIKRLTLLDYLFPLFIGQMNLYIFHLLNFSITEIRIPLRSNIVKWNLFTLERARK